MHSRWTPSPCTYTRLDKKSSASLHYLADVVPHFAWLVSVGLVVLVGEALILRAALAGRRACLAHEDRARAGDFAVATAVVPRRWPTVVAALWPLGIPAVTVWSLASARRLCLTAGDNPTGQAEAFSRGLGGMLNVVPWSINLFVALRSARDPGALSPGEQRSPAEPLARGRRRGFLRPSGGPGVPRTPLTERGRPRVRPGPAARLGHLSRAVRRLGPHDSPHPELRPSRSLARRAESAPVLASLDQAHALFVGRAWLAYPGLAIAVLVSALLVAHWRKAQGVSSAQGATLSWKATLGWSSACLAIAFALFRLAAPFRAENNLPWPAPRLAVDVLRIDQPNGPQLDGPDEIERSPVLQISRRGAWLDGYAVSIDQLGDGLRAVRQTYAFFTRASATRACSWCWPQPTLPPASSRRT